jgi:hypothetical protein
LPCDVHHRRRPTISLSRPRGSLVLSRGHFSLFSQILLPHPGPGLGLRGRSTACHLAHRQRRA